jgi:hypothetical protein
MDYNEIPLRFASDAAKGVSFFEFEEEVSLVVSGEEAVFEVGNVEYA